nr:ribonuclease R [uncultured Peptostreptococcus sp.]
MLAIIDMLRQRVLDLIHDPSYKPLKRDELAKIFVEHRDDKKEFYRLLDQMNEEGDLFINTRKKVASLEAFDLRRGTYKGTKSRFGFLVSNKQDFEDVFIDGDSRKGAFNGDEVLVKITKPAKGNNKAEGLVVRIIKRAKQDLVGLFVSNGSFGFVIVDDKKFDMDIFIPKNYFSGAKNNDKVVCRVTEWSTEEDKKPEGKIIEVLGQKGDRYVEIDSIVRAHGLVEGFNPKVTNQVDNIPDHVLDEEIGGREDLRDQLIYTIDGDDSKDFDDAICVDLLDNGNYRLGVHIADVTHYVTENSPLDREALKRATSVYLVDKVIPMLPKKLSNGICSLNPMVDRLSLSCIMEVEPKNGKVVKYDIAKSVIRSKARLTYHEVSEILENNDPDLTAKYADFLESFKNAGDLAEILRKRRFKRGAIDFDFPESKIQLDSQGIPINIVPYERRTSNKLIEEFMLLANETIAEHYYWLKYPFVYRIHDEPDLEKILTLRNFVQARGYSMRIGRSEVRPSDLQDVLNKIEDKETKQAIGTIMLRSLKQAKYSPSCEGHFGLAAKYYCHFTSPIRRYPDLQIHRIIKENLDGRFNDKRRAHYEAILESVANQSSIQERKAVDAERDVDDYYKAVYMEDKIGQKFEGHISSITSFGIFVELDNGIEGLIRLSTLKDMYEYIESASILVGQRTGRTFMLGQKVEVELVKVNVDAREIDFEMIEGGK